MRENSHVLLFYNSQDNLCILYIRKGILILSFLVYGRLGHKQLVNDNIVKLFVT